MFNMGTQITIRDVDQEVFKEFKADSIRRGMTLGVAITLAMEKFRVELVKKKSVFTKLKPIDWGKGSEHISEEVDKIVYGE